MKDYTCRHLIIGAGPVGLGYAKALQEAGILYDQVEADDDVGGNWYHGVYETAHIISSKKVTEFPEFPMPEAYPDFPSAPQMLDYFRAYTDHFHLRDHIEFEKKVVYVRSVVGSLWEVSFEDGEVRRYQGILVVNGHHWHRKLPDFPGEFAGEFIHSKDYKYPDQVRGKRVLVIGAGNSACDIASEAARIGNEVCQSIRTPAWFFPKTFLGIPLSDLSDYNHLPRWEWVQRLTMKIIYRLTVGKNKWYGIPEPGYRIFDKHPTISTEVLHYIKHGRIAPKPNVTHLDGNFVEFEDGSRQPFDMIVAATGYHLSYPFLPPALNRAEGSVVKVYGGSFMEDYKGLYLIGWLQPRGGIGSLVSPAAQLMAEFIHLQREIQIPIGRVLKSMGQKLPTSPLADPVKLHKKMKRAHKFFQFISKKAKNLDRKYGPFENPVLDAMPETMKQELAEHPMQVY
ncbi:MAG: NAD(P)-binding domain-containing protein [Bacteroidota bacterium]